MRILARRLVCLLACLCLTWPASAQQAEEDKSYIENTLQDLLSSVGREVRVTGFEGALSSNAQLARLTIADADGIWLTLSDAQLVWSRSALLTGRLEIEQLTAARIEMTRPPVAEDTLDLSDAEAASFALPDLPVSINIGQIEAREIILRAPVLGQPARLALAGNLRLQDGTGESELTIDRLDRDDALALEGAFSNETRVLRLDVDLSEAEGGLVSELLDIPDAPALRLTVEGDAPLSDFDAEVTLASDGQPRFGGAVSVSSEDDSAYAFSADLSGDLRPLFAPDLHPFFGEDTRLSASGVSTQDGSTRLDRLRLSSGALTLTGALSLAPDGWPERFNLAAEIGADAPVQLPLSGPPVMLERALLSLRYDITANDRWQGEATLRGLEQEALALAEARLTGEGRITREAGGFVSGQLQFLTDSLRMSDPALARAIGDTPKGSVRFEWQAGQPLTVDALSLASDDMQLLANGTIGALEEGLPATGTAALTTADLSRFAELAGQPLDGAANATLEGRFSLITQAFDIVLSAQTEALRTGISQIDGLTRDTATLRIDARRDETGTQLRALRLETPEARIDASGTLSSRAGQLDLSAEVADITRLTPDLQGPAALDTKVIWENGAPVRLEQLTAQVAGAQIEATGTLDMEDPMRPATGTLSLSAPSLSRFAALLDRPLAGSIDLEAAGQAELSGTSADLSFDLSGNGLRAGLGTLDTLLAGRITASGAIAATDTMIDVSYLKLAGPRLRLNASGSGPGAPIAVAAQLSDLGLLTSAISGPATARGGVTLEDARGETLSLALNATGPAGIAADISGRIRDYGQTLALTVNGSAPLQLANPFIAPRSLVGLAQFDLAINGAPRLSSVSGQITVSEARAALPRLNLALTDLAGQATLSGGQAQVQLGGSLGDGGRFALQGPIALNAPYQSDLGVTLTSLALTDGELYDTSVNGDLTVRGPLGGGATLGGVVTLGETEIRVPSGSGVIIGTLPALTHVGEPSDVRASRARAGLIETGQGSGGPEAVFPLDLTINAPNRIFVRGRGLDAELGGQIRLTGTTADVRPSGVFELIRGRLDILGKRLVLTEGLIDMRGALDPYLRFVAATQADDVLVQIIVEGLASAPDVLFTSIPDLPQEEVVARLLFGRGLDSISAFQAAQLVSAVATLTGRYDGGVVGQLRNALGLSDLDISTTDEGATQFRAGAYISDNVYSEVTADSEGNQQINLNLDISDEVTIRGRAGSDGNTGIGIFFEKDY